MIINDKNIDTATASARVLPVRADLPDVSKHSEETASKKVEKVEDEGNEGVRLDKESVERLVFEVEEHLAQKGIALTFHVEEDSDTIQVEVRDAESNKVIRKIPDDELIRLSKSIKDMAGVFMDKPA